MSGRDERLVAGVDLGGTHMQIGIVDDAGCIVGDRRLQTRSEEGEEAVIERIADGVLDACREAGGARDDLAAVGLAAPGVIDLPRGVVLNAPNLGWHDTPVRDLLHARLGRPVVLDNDVNGAVWGEHRLGAGRGCRNLMAVWVGTGVGGGLVLDGRLYRGPVLSAVEIGWTVLLPDAPAGHRTVEELCSRTGMSRRVRELLPDHPDSTLGNEIDDEGTVPSRALAAAVAAGDPLAVEVVERAADMLGVAIANCVTVLALERVVLGGGVSETLGEPFLRRIRRRFEADVFPEENRVCELRLTELRENAGLLGAAMLAREAVEGP